MGMEDRQSVLSRDQRDGELGFSLIEVLIAAAILLVVALGVLPIFSQAIVNNRAGADYTQVTNLAKSELERLYSLPFSSPELEVVGAETVRPEYFSQKDQKWVDGDPPYEDPPLWTRTTLIRQYGLGGIVDVDKDGKLDGPLPGGTPSAQVHVKEIEIRAGSGRGGGPLGAGKRITLRVYKAY
jgi:prepilin-type N-terminal cleavage/methylation domain-containing protein